MTYDLVRGQGTSRTVMADLDAGLAIRLMRHWASARPQQFLLLRDDRGSTVAFHAPERGTRPPAGTSTGSC
jgi:hypothetical protein